MNSREQFMEWLRTRPEVLNIGFDPVTERFVLREDQERWEAWQAARAGIVVKLPETPNRGIGYGLFDAGKERCAEAIRAVGVGVEE
jgi:hypothetical protein